MGKLIARLTAREWCAWGLTLAAVLWSVFIWHFSWQTGSESAATSGEVLDVCNGLLASAGISIEISAGLVRKLAHFVEFFVLGVFALGAARAHGLLPWHAAGAATLTSLLVAAADEIMQCFTADRGPAVTDVLLDTAGGICGAAALLLGLWLLKLLCRGRRECE